MRIDLAVPFAEKDQAKALGAQWDAHQKVWHIADGLILARVDDPCWDRWVPLDWLQEQRRVINGRRAALQEWMIHPPRGNTMASILKAAGLKPFIKPAGFCHYCDSSNFDWGPPEHLPPPPQQFQ